MGWRTEAGSAPICAKIPKREEVANFQVLVVQRVFGPKRTNLHEKYDYPVSPPTDDTEGHVVGIFGQAALGFVIATLVLATGAGDAPVAGARVGGLTMPALSMLIAQATAWLKAGATRANACAKSPNHEQSAKRGQSTLVLTSVAQLLLTSAPLRSKDWIVLTEFAMRPVGSSVKVRVTRLTPLTAIAL